ncbi:hypothetical protein DL769_010252 [Monosporascus sp. CRB-8-3]|nr:hypothetical protein DL769_010252 [Monosporascus sp. CRB-8-3]
MCRVSLLFLLPALAAAKIDRHATISKHNVVHRQRRFAFNVDNTGTQTSIPFNTLSSWGWHNDSLPDNGAQVEAHSRNITYDLEDPELPEISKWLSANLYRINLGRILGLDTRHNVTKSSDFEIFMGTYGFPLNHTTTLVAEPEGLRRGMARIYHEMGETTYFVNLRWPCASPLPLKRNGPQGPSKAAAHRYMLSTSEACQAWRRTRLHTENLAYEIAYWRWGLDTDAELKRLLSQPAPEKWTTVAEDLAPPLHVDGMYMPWEVLNSSWWEVEKLSKDPRSVIILQGILPDTPAVSSLLTSTRTSPVICSVFFRSDDSVDARLAVSPVLRVDPGVGLKTFDKMWGPYKDEQMWGRARHVLAIKAARVGHSERAIYQRINYEYWTFDGAGYAYRSGPGKSSVALATPPF